MAAQEVVVARCVAWGFARNGQGKPAVHREQSGLPAASKGPQGPRIAQRRAQRFGARRHVQVVEGPPTRLNGVADELAARLLTGRLSLFWRRDGHVAASGASSVLLVDGSSSSGAKWGRDF